MNSITVIFSPFPYSLSLNIAVIILFSNMLQLHSFLGENFQPTLNKCGITVLYTGSYIIFIKKIKVKRT
jgi:hypothetical protein